MITMHGLTVFNPCQYCGTHFAPCVDLYEGYVLENRLTKNKLDWINETMFF